MTILMIILPWAFGLPLQTTEKELIYDIRQCNAGQVSLTCTPSPNPDRNTVESLLAHNAKSWRVRLITGEIRVKDSKEQLRTTRARGASNATIDSSTTSTTAGRSFTVANINNGIIYLRYVHI